MANSSCIQETSQNTGFEIGQLLHPAQAFLHPQQVVDDPDLTPNEKRAVLAAWASDACAVEGMPSRRQVPGSPQTVSIDDILAALTELDRQAHQDEPIRWARRQMRRGSIELLRNNYKRPTSNPH